MIRILVLVLALVSTSAFAQEFQGIATYKTKRHIDIKLDSTKANDAMRQQMIEMMKKQFEKTFTLSFNKSESIYKEEESLSKPQVGGIGGDFQIMTIGSGGGGDIYYKNTAENRYVNQTDTYGKIFLIKDDIEKREWQLEPQTKYIGEYLCHEATLTEEYEYTEMRRSSDEDKEPETTMRERVITAWYTLQIPVNSGPADYQGLPGLIMEIDVDNGKQSILCSKIVLNPKDQVDIKEPSKGKEISQKDFDDVMEKKSKEMMERFRPRNGREGESIEIRIGG
ncbi:GLPGLI family protein [Winogradskyella maritima]|uniref:GLPGLI family protein n=1 Tax=Winogradskyella maritima TaxID=1517766 RepID=A0ABV8ADB1_9FLAO|nr:GLPGLI family protein [Winogradskyella maritima]